MDSIESMLIKITDVDEKRRPKLADILAIADGSAYLLSSELLSAEPGDERLVVLIKTDSSIGLIEDIPASYDGKEPENYHLTMLDDIAVRSFWEITGAPVKQRKESTGRPPKYNLEREGMDIFIQHVYEGNSIKKIAYEQKMSPTTVQKLLNQARLQAVDKFMNGTWSISKDSVNWPRNLEVIRWAAKHTTGLKQQQYNAFLKSLED